MSPLTSSRPFLVLIAPPQGLREGMPVEGEGCEPTTEPVRKRHALDVAPGARRGVLLRWVCRGSERSASGITPPGDRRLVLKSFEIVPMPQGATQLEGASLANAPSMANTILARSPNLRPGAIVIALVPLVAPAK